MSLAVALICVFLFYFLAATFDIANKKAKKAVYTSDLATSDAIEEHDDWQGQKRMAKKKIRYSPEHEKSPSCENQKGKTDAVVGHDGWKGRKRVVKQKIGFSHDFERSPSSQNQTGKTDAPLQSALHNLPLVPRELIALSTGESTGVQPRLPVGPVLTTEYIPEHERSNMSRMETQHNGSVSPDNTDDHDTNGDTSPIENSSHHGSGKASLCHSVSDVQERADCEKTVKAHNSSSIRSASFQQQDSKYKLKMFCGSLNVQCCA